MIKKWIWFFLLGLILAIILGLIVPAPSEDTTRISTPASATNPVSQFPTSILQFPVPAK